MGKNNEKQFTITLTERQLKLLAYACRVTDRRHPLRYAKGHGACFMAGGRPGKAVKLDQRRF